MMKACPSGVHFRLLYLALFCEVALFDNFFSDSDERKVRTLQIKVNEMAQQLGMSGKLKWDGYFLTLGHRCAVPKMSSSHTAPYALLFPLNLQWIGCRTNLVRRWVHPGKAAPPVLLPARPAQTDPVLIFRALETTVTKRRCLEKLQIAVTG